MLSVSGYRGVERREYESDHLKRTADELETYLVVKPGELVLNTMWLNHCGLGVAKEEGIVSPAYRVFGLDRSTLDLGFCHHLLRSEPYVQEYTRLAYGIRPNSLQVSTEDFGLLPIPIPSLTEQRSIAGFLDRKTAAIDDLIAKKERLIELLGEKSQTIITQAVTKGLDPTVPMKDSEIKCIGKIPAHWECATLRRGISSVRNGTSAPQVDGAVGCIPVSRIETISTGDIDYDRVGWVEASAKLSEFRLAAGDILLSHINSVSMLGNCAFFDGTGELHVGMNLLRLRPGQAVVPRFLFWWLRSASTRDDIRARGKPAINQASIPMGDLKDVPLLLPPIREQREVAEFLDEQALALRQVVQRNELLIDLLREYRQALISAAVTGKIEIPSEEAA